MVRAKFKCDGENKTLYGIEYVFSPVISGSIENESFFQTTPSGKISVHVNPKKTSARFELGVEYYVDFNACDGSAIQSA